MWEKIDIWKNYDDKTVACYRIFRNLNSGLYSVQSMDFIRSEADIKNSNAQDIELFLEESPGERSSGFQRIEDAISAFDADFRE